MPSCSLPSAATWPARHGPARGTARSGPACGCSTASGSAGPACCGSWVRTICSRRIAVLPGRRTTTTARSPPRRRTSCGVPTALIPTVEDGNVTLFIVAEHWNAEGLGWHVARHGNRYAAAEALALAVSRVFGSVGADAARSVSLRHDHGSPFMSEHFQNQLKFFGMTPSFAFVREPETNGVAERFIRTLKEQIVFGRIYQDIEELRTAIRAYFERYNQHWLLEKNGYRSPAETRRYWTAATSTAQEAA